MAGDVLRRFALFDVHRRRRPGLVLVMVAILEFSLLYLVSLLGTPRHFVGIPGPVAVLIAVAAAVLEGPLVGGVAVVIAGVAFLTITSRFGQDVELITVVYSVLLWMVATLAAGFTAEQARREILARERDLSDARDQAVAGQEAVERILMLTPSFLSLERQQQLEEGICQAARAAFDADHCWLVELAAGIPRVLGVHPPGTVRVQGTPRPTPGTGTELPPDRSAFFTGLLTKPDAPGWLVSLTLAAGTRSSLAMRLRLEGPTTHIIVLGWLQQRVPPDRAEEALVRRFADQAALALERAAVDRLHGRLEASLLPRLPIAHPTLRVHARYRTGESRLGIGGDFFDFLPTAGAGAAFLIGDVSGRGVDAAALGAGLRATWRALTLAETGRELLVTTMAEALSREAGDPGLFTTVLLGDVAPDGHEVTFLNFGHQPPLLMAGSVRELQIARTLPLGLWTGSPWPSTTVTLPRSWKLFLYTDGLIEGLAAPTGEERYGVERLKADLQRVGMADGGDAALDRLLAEVEAANGGELLDDVAILTIEDTRP